MDSVQQEIQRGARSIREQVLKYTVDNTEPVHSPAGAEEL